MHFDISTEFLREVISDEHLSADHIRAIAQVAYVAAEIDLNEDIDEQDTLDALCEQLWAIAGLAPEPIAPISPIPIDGEERRWLIRKLAEELTTRRARELAYAFAYLLVASDLQLAPVEGRFLDDLQRALSINDERAADLAAASAEQVTPNAPVSTDRSQ